MILALALLWQTSTTTPADTPTDRSANALPVAPPTLIVRAGNKSASLSVLTPGDDKSPVVSAERLATAMGGTLTKTADGHYVLKVGDATLDFVDGVARVRTDSGNIALPAAPVVIGSTLYLPFTIAADVIPQYVTGFLYDDEHGELRAFSSTVRHLKRADRVPVNTATKTAPAARARPDSGTDDTPPAEPAAPADDNAESATLSDDDLVLAPTHGKKRLVVVDAGHGGVDPGMKGPLGGGPTWLHEKVITLAVAKLVAKELRARGVNVLMTRTTDTLIALADRGRIANAAHGDLFVSVHVNATGSRGRDGARERGYETYFLAEAKTEDARRVERMENEAVKFETGVNASKGDPLSFIINDMAQNEHLRESNELAQLIQDGFRSFHPGPSRGVQQANFAVLRGSFMPAVLVEIGFGTNPQEASFISDADNQRTIARSIARSVISYLKRYEARLGGKK